MAATKYFPSSIIHLTHNCKLASINSSNYYRSSSINSSHGEAPHLNITTIQHRPTFYKIYKRKSSAGYPSLPYIIALFSASLLLYYAVLKTNAYLLIAINAFGGVIELAYLFIYIVYAPKRTKIFTGGLVFVFNVACLGGILVFSLAFAEGTKRVQVVGWMCASINIAVFASPLSIMTEVVKTKSVEFMPIALSVFLTVNATMWFFYGFFARDYYIAVPNVLGFAFSIVQILLYFIYKKAKPVDMNMECGNEEARGDIREIMLNQKTAATVVAKVDAEKDAEMGII